MAKVSAPARKCGAITRTPDKHECRNAPLKNSKRCKFHGGKTPGAIKAAELARAQAEMTAAMKKLGDTEPVADPLRELSGLAGEVRAWKDLLRRHLARLDNQLRYSGFQGGEQIRGEVVLYERALDRCVQVLATIAKLNIDERLAAIEERQAATVDRALTAALEELGLSAEQRQAASATLIRHLRLVA